MEVSEIFLPLKLGFSYHMILEFFSHLILIEFPFIDTQLFWS